MGLENSLESLLRSNQSILKEINSIFIARANAEAPILWTPHVKNRLIGKDPDLGERPKAGGEKGDRG